jgi:regulator of sirC expression with transglutaminase-like and TPR domain
MAEFLFQEEGFRPNEADYYDPDNSYFHRVLERKLGIPITLSCLYIFLGRRVHLPFQGIGLPGHFIVQLTPPSARPGAEGQRYYVDPYHKGQILTLAQCRQILSRQGIAQAPKYFSPVTDRAILARVIANLIRIYESRGNPLRSERLTRLFSSLEAR